MGGGGSASVGGKNSIRSLTLQNQGAFAVGVAGYSVVKSRDFNQNAGVGGGDTDGHMSAGQTSNRNNMSGSRLNLRNKLD